MKLIFFLFVLTILFWGCGNTCELDAENYRSRECAINVKSRFAFGRWFSIDGTNPVTGSRNRFADMGSWYPAFQGYVAVGDTVIKRRNELVFYVHKKDTVLTFPFQCDGRTYK